MIVSETESVPVFGKTHPIEVTDPAQWSGAEGLVLRLPPTPALVRRMGALGLLMAVGLLVAVLMILDDQILAGSVSLGIILVMAGFVVAQALKIRRLGSLRADAKGVQAFDGPLIPWEALLDVELMDHCFLFAYELNPSFVEEFRVWAREEVARGNADQHASRRQWHQLVTVVTRNPFRQTYQLQRAYVPGDHEALVSTLLRERDHARHQLFDRLHARYADGEGGDTVSPV